MRWMMVFSLCRFGFLEKVACEQFEVCASLSDRDHLRKVETEPTKVLLLDSEHKLWVWQPMKKGSPSILPGFSRHNGEAVFSCVIGAVWMECL